MSKDNFRAALLLLAGATAIILGVSIIVNQLEAPPPPPPPPSALRQTKQVTARTNRSSQLLLAQKFLRDAASARPYVVEPAPAAAAAARVEPSRERAKAPPPSSAAAAPVAVPLSEAPAASVAPAAFDTKAWCVRTHGQHRVRPGVSWGTLEKKLRRAWIDRGCDAFFCEPNDRAGRGVYKCAPLPAAKIT